MSSVTERFLLQFDPSLIAMGFLAMLGFTAFALWRFRRRPPSWAMVALHVVGIAILAMVLFPLFATPGGDFAPLYLWLTPILGSVVLVHGVRHPWLGWAGAVCTIVLGMLLTELWTGLAATSPYATRREASRAERRAESFLRWNREKRFLAVLRQVPQAPPKLPSGFLDRGWYSENGLSSLARGGGPRLRPIRVRLVPLWHSGLTGLYRAETTHLVSWTPGGTPEEAARGLELRERPRS